MPTPFLRLAGLLLLALALPVDGAGEVYKCRTADGSLAYQDQPCRTGTSEVVDFGGAGRRARARLEDPACIPIARELWRLNATVNYTDQTAQGRALVEERRATLASQCQLKLERTELASRCSQLERAINQASDKGSAAFDRAGQQYDTTCSEAEIEADIQRSIRPIETDEAAAR
jgi:hypothetical protein